MPQNLAETHIGHLTIVDDRLRTGLGGHEIASEKAEARIGIGLAQLAYQLRGMKVA